MVALRFRKSVSLMPGVRLNLGTRGFSVRIGTKGIGHTIGTSGQRTTFGIPGSGVSFTEVHSRVPKSVAAHRYDDVLDYAGPRRIRWHRPLRIACGLFLLGGFAVYFLEPTQPTSQAQSAATVSVPREPTAEEKEAAAKKVVEELVFQRNVASVRQLKSAMKNPATFKLEQALRTSDGALCLNYRATNSFNAVVPGRAVITKGKILTSDSDRFAARWNARCANKKGEDVSYIRQALLF